MRPTDTQIRIIVDTVKQYGLLAMAASNAGMSPGALKGLLARDEDLAQEVDDAMALFRDALTMEVLDRAVRGKSDAMLKLAAESLNPSVFKQSAVDPKAKNKPTGLVLRTFDSDGNEEDAAASTTASTTATLKLTMERGL